MSRRNSQPSGQQTTLNMERDNSGATTTTTNRNNNKKIHVNWSSPQKQTLGFFGLAAVILLIIHINSFFKIKDFKKPTQDVTAPLFSALNLFSVFGGMIGFGKPYWAGYPSFIGFVITGIWGYVLRGLADWLEKFFIIITVLCVLGEYFYYGFKNGEKDAEDNN